MKLRFIDSPTVLLPNKLPPDTALKFSNSVRKAWSAWAGNAATAFPAAQSPEFSFTSHELAVALMQDCRNQVPYRHALSLVSAVVDEEAADLSFHQHLPGCSQRFKAITSEWMAAMVSIAYASRCGLGFLGSMPHVNKLWPGAWSRRWKGDGPDYLFATIGGQSTFLEAKGRGGPATSKANLVDDDFVRHKVQSLNAKLLLPKVLPTPSPSRFVLSRVTMELNGRVQLQWFNQAGGTKPAVCKPLVLAVALSNYLQVARAQGVEMRNAVRTDGGLLVFSPPETSNAAGADRRFARDTVFMTRSTRELFDGIERVIGEFGEFGTNVWNAGFKEVFEPEVERFFEMLVGANLSDAGPLLGQQLSATLGQKIVGLPMGYAVAL